MRSAAQEAGLSEDRIFILEGTSTDGRRSLEDLINDVYRKRIPRLPIRPAKRDTLAYLVFSSGTTGLPKGEFLRSVYLCRAWCSSVVAVMISHGNIWYTFKAAAVAGEEEQKTFGVCSPLNLHSGM